MFFYLVVVQLPPFGCHDQISKIQKLSEWFKIWNLCLLCNLAFIFITITFLHWQEDCLSKLIPVYGKRSKKRVTYSLTLGNVIHHSNVFLEEKELEIFVSEFCRTAFSLVWLFWALPFHELRAPFSSDTLVWTTKHLLSQCLTTQLAV